MFKAFITCILTFTNILIFAQNFTLTGTILDENKLPIVYSNVIISKSDTSTLIDGSTTDEAGSFLFENLKPDTYSLKISFIGFEDQTIKIELVKNTNLGVIILKEKLETLNDVTITAKRPTVKRMVDRLVFNVENSTLSNTNVLDVLKHTPGVLVHDGKITIKRSIPTVYINDRKVQLSIEEVQQLLEGTSATTVKSIEVITNPPAKYEAEGGSVLNIVTSKNIVAGYNGNVSGNYSKGEHDPKYTFGTSHFFKTKKLNTYLNYSINPRKDFRQTDESVNFIENNLNTTRWETDFERTQKTSNQNINANIDYDLNAANSFNLSTNMLVSPRKNTKKVINSLTEVYNAVNVLDSTFQTHNRLDDETFNLAITLDYVHKFKKEGEKLSISTHHTNYDFSSFQDVKTGYFFPNTVVAFRDNNFQTLSKQAIKLNTGQLDYELPISETSQFEVGAKVSTINSKSTLNKYIFENSEKIDDLLNSDVFLYDETNSALYSSYAKDWEHWSLKSGIRIEYTNIKGTSIVTNSDSNKAYLKFFPSFYLLKRFNENNEIYFDYNKRIYRPRYNELNPFKYFFSDNSYLTGDPNLKPQLDHSFTLGYTFNKDYTFEFYYRYEKNPTLQVAFQHNDEKIFEYKNTNLNKSISYGLDFITYTPFTNRWNFYLQSSVFYYNSYFFAFDGSNELITNNKFSLYGQLNNYFSFLKDKSLTADVSYLYISQMSYGDKNISRRQGLDITLRKTFGKGRTSINMGVNDVFNTQNFTTTTKYLNQDIFVKSKLENRLFVFGFTYKFGNFNLKTNQKPIDLEERNRLETKQN